MWVFDATPLIYLAKAGRLDHVDHLDDSCVIPRRVHREVVTDGLERGYPDARRVDRAVEDGRFDVEAAPKTPTFDRLRRNPNLSDADAAVLSLAASNDGTAVMDERYGRAVAETEEIDARGTAYLVLSLATDGRIDRHEARETIDAMVDAGWYCAPDVYANIVGTIESRS